MLAIKLTLVPLLILLASYVTQKFGPRIGGMLAAMPLVAGPITVLLALEQGEAFALDSIATTMPAITAVAVFCLIYSRMALFANAGWALVAAGSGYMVVAFVILVAAPGTLAGFCASLLCLPLLGALMPKRVSIPKSLKISRLELSVRLCAAALLVLLVTALAESVGSAIGGVLSVFPVASSVMAVFTHHNSGTSAVVLLLRGITVGLIGLLLFYALWYVLAEPLGFFNACAAALLCLLVYQWLFRQISQRLLVHSVKC